MTDTPYARRRIRLTFTLGQGSFGASGKTTLVFNDLRVEAAISHVILPSPGGTAMVRCYGMTLDHINQLTVAGTAWLTRQNNTIKIEAGDVDGPFVSVHEGTIFQAYPDFNTMPNVGFVVTSNPGAVVQMKPVAPVTVQGSADVTALLTAIVAPFGFTVENNGVSVKLSNPYLQGSAWTQVLRVIKAANVYAFFDAVAKVLSIWPKTGNRATSSPPVFSPETGMIGYPEFQQARIIVRSRFDPSLVGPPGKLIEVKSQLAAANGKWVINNVEYALSARVPGGPWEMKVVVSSPPLGQGGG